MLFDERGEVLLVRFVVPRAEGEFVFWALPGGEIETGEREAEAAVREVKEELGSSSGGDAGQRRFSFQGRVSAGGASTDRSYGR
jgi:ADP-ribose pyrophosphatase YjhB (NUDIX family)